jgi:hypothetical protein
MPSVLCRIAITNLRAGSTQPHPMPLPQLLQLPGCTAGLHPALASLLLCKHTVLAQTCAMAQACAMARLALPAAPCKAAAAGKQVAGQPRLLTTTSCLGKVQAALHNSSARLTTTNSRPESASRCNDAIAACQKELNEEHFCCRTRQAHTTAGLLDQNTAGTTLCAYICL